MSSVVVFDCRNSQVLYTIIIDNNDTRCSEVTTQMDHTTGPGILFNIMILITVRHETLKGENLPEFY